MSQNQYLIVIASAISAGVIAGLISAYLRSKFGLSDWVTGFISSFMIAGAILLANYFVLKKRK